MSNILVVDDERPVRKLLKRILEEAGYSCRDTENAGLAKRLLAKDDFTLLLSDIHMPGESGIELVRYVKKHHPETGVVIVSVVDEPAEAKEALEMGVYGYITKPFTKNIVRICVENALHHHELERKEQAQQADLETKVRESTADLEKAYALLQQREAKIALQVKELEELNSALRVLLQKRDRDRQSMEESIMANLEKHIKPCLQRLKSAAQGNRRLKREIQIIESGLDEFVEPFVKSISSCCLGLTPNEIKVATLIRQGLTTKEVANLLSLSQNTIMTHRYNIRTKLGIKNKQQSLQTYLANLKDQ